MDDLTRLPGEVASAGTLTSSGAEWGRFAPGTVFAGRFRIVAPLGPLKFLPDYASLGGEPMFGRTLLD